jgi:hypothetical protein
VQLHPAQVPTDAGLLVAILPRCGEGVDVGQRQVATVNGSDVDTAATLITRGELAPYP